MTSTRTTTETLHKQLIKVQARGGTVWSTFRKTNLDMYQHVAEIYFWWASASKKVGFLDTEYSKLPIKFRKTKQLINFIPLFWLVWGTTNCNKDVASRHSKAMNKIHKEYLRDKRFYKKEGTYRLAKFIEKNNGIDGLCDYKRNEIDTEEEFYKDDDLAKNQNLAFPQFPRHFS